MITVIVNHYVLPDQLRRAKAGIRENGRLMRSYPGFVSRQTLIAQQDPLQVTTVTSWRRMRDYQGWTNRPGRPQPAPGAPTRWSRPVETSIFRVTPER